MCLKPSKSKNSTATFFMWRCAKVIACLTRSFRSIRLGNPVRKSCWAEWVSCTAMAPASFHWGWTDFASHAVHDSEYFRHGPTCRFFPRPARHFFRDEIEERDISRDVCANNCVADAVERDLGAFLFHEQCLFHDLALDGIAQGSQKPARLDLALDEIVLRAFLQGLCGHRFVVQARQHHQGDAGRGCVGPPYRSQSLCIGQPQVEQDNVYRIRDKMTHRLLHGFKVR